MNRHPTAWVLLRDGPHYRRDAVRRGLERAGFRVEYALPANARATDALVVWNRYGVADRAATGFPGLVFVLENGYLGHDFRGEKWYALSLDDHNGAGRWYPDDHTRWRSLGVAINGWQADPDGPLVVLGQRGIGRPGLASPRGWESDAVKQIEAAFAGGRQTRRGVVVKPHPGAGPAQAKLGSEIRGASALVTWASGAAIKGLLFGYPVLFACPSWVGRDMALPLDRWCAGEPLRLDSRARLLAFESLAYAMWTVGEIETGAPFVRLMEKHRADPRNR